jgi:hypothetical protein
MLHQEAERVAAVVTQLTAPPAAHAADLSRPAPQPPLQSVRDTPAERAVHLLIRIDLAMRHLAGIGP